MGLVHGELTERIIAGAIEVHRSLGPGFIESIYENALRIELGRRGLQVDHQFEVIINYAGVEVGKHRLDLLVEGITVIELKAIRNLDDIHFAVVKSYLKAAGNELGLLLNFAKITLEIKRVICRQSPVRFLVSWLLHKKLSETSCRGERRVPEQVLSVERERRRVVVRGEIARRLIAAFGHGARGAQVAGIGVGVAHHNRRTTHALFDGRADLVHHFAGQRDERHRTEPERLHFHPCFAAITPRQDLFREGLHLRFVDLLPKLIRAG
jgi:GxxExxY protein